MPLTYSDQAIVVHTSGHRPATHLRQSMIKFAQIERCLAEGPLDPAFTNAVHADEFEYYVQNLISVVDVHSFASLRHLAHDT